MYGVEKIRFNIWSEHWTENHICKLSERVTNLCLGFSTEQGSGLGGAKVQVKKTRGLIWTHSKLQLCNINPILWLFSPPSLYSMGTNFCNFIFVKIWKVRIIKWMGSYCLFKNMYIVIFWDLGHFVHPLCEDTKKNFW